MLLILLYVSILRFNMTSRNLQTLFSSVQHQHAQLVCKVPNVQIPFFHVYASLLSNPWVYCYKVSLTSYFRVYIHERVCMCVRTRVELIVCVYIIVECVYACGVVILYVDIRNNSKKIYCKPLPNGRGHIYQLF